MSLACATGVKPPLRPRKQRRNPAAVEELQLACHNKDHYTGRGSLHLHVLGDWVSEDLALTLHPYAMLKAHRSSKPFMGGPFVGWQSPSPIRNPGLTGAFWEEYGSYIPLRGRLLNPSFQRQKTLDVMKTIRTQTVVVLKGNQKTAKSKLLGSERPKVGPIEIPSAPNVGIIHILGALRPQGNGFP